eukprot:1133392-Pelagomonas_calceolata.AAC.1
MQQYIRMLLHMQPLLPLIFITIRPVHGWFARPSSIVPRPTTGLGKTSAHPPSEVQMCVCSSTHTHTHTRTHTHRAQPTAKEQRHLLAPRSSSRPGKRARRSSSSMRSEGKRGLMGRAQKMVQVRDVSVRVVRARDVAVRMAEVRDVTVRCVMSL